MLRSARADVDSQPAIKEGHIAIDGAAEQERQDMAILRMPLDVRVSTIMLLRASRRLSWSQRRIVILPLPISKTVLF